MINRYDSLSALVVAVGLSIFMYFIHHPMEEKVDRQTALIEQLQGNVKAMTSAFEEISLELLKSQYAYSSWSGEIKKLRKAMSDAPEIPEIGRWKNRKETTRGMYGN